MWLKLFPEQGSQDTSKSSHELPMGSLAKVEPGSGKQCVHTHFPNDPNCDVCMKTKITRSSCRRRGGAVVPRAEHSGDLITADHKVQWRKCIATQSSICRGGTRLGNTVIYTDHSMECWQVLRGIFLDHCTSTPHRSETNAIAERAVRRVKAGTPAVLV